MVTHLNRSILSLSVKVKQQEELLGKCRDNIQQNVSRSAALSAENERLRSQLADSQVRARVRPVCTRGDVSVYCTRSYGWL